VGAPGKRWGLDLTGPHQMSNGYKYMFTAICQFSKFGVAVPIRNKEASTVAKALIDNVFLKWGLPHEVLTDQGSEFEAELLNELLKLLGVARLRTSSFRPQGNGACEVWHRTLNTMISKVIAENQRDWPLWVPYVTFCYNATTHSATHFPPFFIFTGRLPLWNIDLVLPDTEVTNLKLPEYAAGVVNRLNEASKLVRSHLQAAAQTSSRWYNNKAKVKTFKPGDIVRIYYPRRYVGRSPKWQSYYSTVGQVVERLNDVTYRVASKQWKKNKVIHVDKIKNVIFSIHVSVICYC